MTLDHSTLNQAQAGQIVYAAERQPEPLPFNQFVLTRFEVTLTGTTPVDFKIDPSRSYVRHAGTDLLEPNGTLGLTLTPGSSANANQNPPNTTTGAASGRPWSAAACRIAARRSGWRNSSSRPARSASGVRAARAAPVASRKRVFPTSCPRIGR